MERRAAWRPGAALSKSWTVRRWGHNASKDSFPPPLTFESNKKMLRSAHHRPTAGYPVYEVSIVHHSRPAVVDSGLLCGSFFHDPRRYAVLHGDVIVSPT